MLEFGKYYHIYNRANGSENLFVIDENYHFFLKKYKLYILPIADTFSYCLMPNHFHFFVRIKLIKEIIDFFESKHDHGTTAFSKVLNFGKDEKADSLFLSKQFSNLFSSYTQAFNKQQSRTGSLFQKNFKAKEVGHLGYFQHLIQYIHCNPVHHRFCDDYKDWVFSSFHALVSNSETDLDRQTVISWFGNKKNLISSHNEKVSILNSLKLE